MPRDFDISPYFEIVKPTIERGFDYTKLHWADTPKPPREVAEEDDPFPEGVFEAPGLVPELADADGELPVAARQTAEPERIAAHAI